MKGKTDFQFNILSMIIEFSGEEINYEKIEIYKKKLKDKNESNTKVVESFDYEKESEESTVEERNCNDSEE